MRGAARYLSFQFISMLLLTKANLWSHKTSDEGLTYKNIKSFKMLLKTTCTATITLITLCDFHYWPWTPWEWITSNFSLEYHYYQIYILNIKITTESQIKVERIEELFTKNRSTWLLKNSPCWQTQETWRTVWRICILMLGCKGFMT